MLAPVDFVIDIDIENPAAIEGPDILENRMADDDVLHSVPGTDQVEGINGYRPSAGFVIDQAPVPDRSVGPV